MVGGIISRIFLVAIIGGALAGLFHTAIQQIAVIPLILEAETYETGDAGAGAHSHEVAGQGQDVAVGTQGHSHDEEAWSPEDGIERLAYTALANVLLSVGFALLLCAGFALKGGVTWRSGMLWGLGGFVAFSLSPGIGLPPELPGAAAAALYDRQIWWIAAAVCGIAGLALIAFARKPVLKALGAVVLVLPHIIGAPQPDSHAGLAPPALEEAFIYASLATNAVFWVFLGGLTGYLFDRWPGTRGKHSTVTA